MQHQWTFDPTIEETIFDSMEVHKQEIKPFPVTLPPPPPSGYGSR